MEISPAAPSREDRFLHAMIVTNASNQRDPEVRRIESAECIGVQVLGRAVLFGRRAQEMDRVSFSLKANASLNVLVCDLKPGRWQLACKGKTRSTELLVGESSKSFYFQGVSGDYRLRRISGKTEVDRHDDFWGHLRKESLALNPSERILRVSDQIVRCETIFRDDLSRDLGDWLTKGGAAVWLENGRLFIDARAGDPPVGAIWCTNRFEGDAVIEYTARVEKGDGRHAGALENRYNLNFFLFGSKPDRSSVLETTDARRGDYSDYHKINNYIITYLNQSRDEEANRDTGPTALRTRVRFRKKPGFHLLEELWRDPIEGDRDYHFAAVIQGPRLRSYVDNRLLFDHTDQEQPHRQGRHAFRTWRSFISIDDFQVS